MLKRSHFWFSFLWERTKAAGIILKCIGIYSLPRFSQMEQSWLGFCFALLIGYFFFIEQMDDDPKHTAKATQEFLKVKKVECSAMAKSISWSQSDWSCISLAEDKAKNRKQTTTEVSCSKGLAKHHKGGNPGCVLNAILSYYSYYFCSMQYVCCA